MEEKTPALLLSSSPDLTYMASLTESSIIARKVIRYAIYGLILIIILRFTIKLGVGIYRKIFPAPPPKPTVAFGKLPTLPFPEKAVPPDLTYTLETPDGKLPVLAKQVEIYFMPPIPSNIRVLETAKEKARSLGFNPEGRLLVENVPNVYIFQGRNPASSLTMNIITGVFSISYDLSSDPSAISGMPPAPEAAIAQARSRLQSAGLLHEDLSEGRTTHEFLRIEGGKFVSAVSLSEASAIKVNLFRKSFGKDIPSVSPDAKQANIWFMFVGGSGQIIGAEYHYFPMDEKNPATYPLKTADETWEELKSGKSYVANLGDNESGNITIRRVYLAYYDAGQYTAFYQPIVVFEGDNDFTAYVPAVASNFYGGEEE